MSDILLLEGISECISGRVLEFLDHAGIMVVDILTLDAVEVSRRSKLSVSDAEVVGKWVLERMNMGVSRGMKTGLEREIECGFLTTGDGELDRLLGGGIPTGSITEVAGERCVFSESVG